MSESWLKLNSYWHNPRSRVADIIIPQSQQCTPNQDAEEGGEGDQEEGEPGIATNTKTWKA